MSISLKKIKDDNVAVSMGNNLWFCFCSHTVTAYYSELNRHIEQAAHAKSLNSIHKEDYCKSTLCL